MPGGCFLVKDGVEAWHVGEVGKAWVGVDVGIGRDGEIGSGVEIDAGDAVGVHVVGFDFAFIVAVAIFW